MTNPSNEPKGTIFEHLAALKLHLTWGVLSIILVTLVVYALWDVIIVPFLISIYSPSSAYSSTLLATFTQIRFAGSIDLGFYLGLPFLLLQFLFFALPGLYRKEKVWATVVFLVSVVAYLSIPIALLKLVTPLLFVESTRILNVLGLGADLAITITNKMIIISVIAMLWLGYLLLPVRLHSYLGVSKDIKKSMIWFFTATVIIFIMPIWMLIVVLFYFPVFIGVLLTWVITITRSYLVFAQKIGPLRRISNLPDMIETADTTKTVETPQGYKPRFHFTEHLTKENEPRKLQEVDVEEGEADIVLVEQSFYFGDMLPKVPDGTEIRIIYEKPWLFSKRFPLSVMYTKGREIPSDGLLPRAKLELLAREIEMARSIDDLIRVTQELLIVRKAFPNRIIYNEPKEWLRDVRYDTDLLFEYIRERANFKLFGVFLFSDMDEPFAKFVASTHRAIHEMSGPQCLLFTFEPLGVLYENASFIKYETIRHHLRNTLLNNLAPTPQDLDLMRAIHDRIAEVLFNRNIALRFARELGVQFSDTPCIAFWTSSQESEVLVYSFDNAWVDTGEIHEHMKAIFDIIQREIESLSSGEHLNLSLLEQKFLSLKIKRSIRRFFGKISVGDIIQLAALGKP